MPEQTGPPALDLESVQGMVARAILYAAETFADGMREPNPNRRSAYNLIVYGAPQLLVEVRRLRADRDQYRSATWWVRKLHEQYRSPWIDDYDVCSHCTRGMEQVPWPCPTVQALNEAMSPDRAVAGGGAGNPTEAQPPPTTCGRPGCYGTGAGYEVQAHTVRCEQCEQTEG